MTTLITKRVTGIEVPGSAFYRDSFQSEYRKFQEHTAEEAYAAAWSQLLKALADKERAVQRVRTALDQDTYEWGLYFLGIVRQSVRCQIAHCRQIRRTALNTSAV